MRLLIWALCVGIIYADVSHLATHQGYTYTKPVPSFQIPLPSRAIPSNAYIPPATTKHFEQPVQATVSIIAPAPLPDSPPPLPPAPSLPPLRAPAPPPPQVQTSIQSLPPVLAPPLPAPASLPTPNFAISSNTQETASLPQYPPVTNNEYMAPAPQYLPPINYNGVSTSATNLPPTPTNLAPPVPNPISHSSSLPSSPLPANEYLPPVQQYQMTVYGAPAFSMNLSPPVLPPDSNEYILSNMKELAPAGSLPQYYIPPPPPPTNRDNIPPPPPPPQRDYIPPPPPPPHRDYIPPPPPQPHQDYIPPPSPSQNFGTVAMPAILQSRPSNEYSPPSVLSTNDLSGYHYQAPQK